MAGRDGKPTTLTLERLRRGEREIAVLRRDTNARLDQTNARLEQVVDVLTRLVGVVAAQGEKFDRLNERFEDRLTEAILEGRTHDTERVTGLERRVPALEQRLRGTPPPGEKA